LGISYIDKWIKQSELKLRSKKTVMKKFQKNGVQGLFELFLPDSFWMAIVTWTNEWLQDIGNKKNKITMPLLKAYVGLEIAMSIHPLNNMKDYWSDKKFLGVGDLKEVLRLETKAQDPLWFSRSVMNTMLSNCLAVAVSDGVQSFDELSIRTKAGTTAKTYMGKAFEIYRREEVIMHDG